MKNHDAQYISKSSESIIKSIYGHGLHSKLLNNLRVLCNLHCIDGGNLAHMMSHAKQHLESMILNTKSSLKHNLYYTKIGKHGDIGRENSTIKLITDIISPAKVHLIPKVI